MVEAKNTNHKSGGTQRWVIGHCITHSQHNFATFYSLILRYNVTLRLSCSDGAINILCNKIRLMKQDLLPTNQRAMRLIYGAHSAMMGKSVKRFDLNTLTRHIRLSAPLAFK